MAPLSLITLKMPSFPRCLLLAVLVARANHAAGGLTADDVVFRDLASWDLDLPLVPPQKKATASQLDDHSGSMLDGWCNMPHVTLETYVSVAFKPSDSGRWGRADNATCAESRPENTPSDTPRSFKGTTSELRILQIYTTRKILIGNAVLQVLCMVWQGETRRTSISITHHSE